MRSNSNFALGVVFILLCAIIWSGTAIATQYLYSGTDFESPYFITYLANFSLSLHLILYRFRKIKNRPPFRHKDKANEISNETDSTLNDGIITDGRYIDTVERNDYNDEDRNNDCGKRLLDSTENLAALAEGSNANVNNNYSHIDILKSVLWLAPLWFLCNITWNYALRMTSNSSCTIINNTAASFTLIFSSTLGLEKITLGKVLGLLLCFGGAVCVGFEDKSNYDADLEKTSFWGDIVALSSAALDGMYITCIRLKVPDDTDPQDGGLSMQLVFGYVGIINLVALLPLTIAFFIINFDDVDSITIGIVAFIFINTCFDNLIADFLWGRATLLTSPTIATLTMSLTIPIAMVSDTILGKSYASEKKLSIIGAILVVFGFILVTFDIDLFKLCAPRFMYRSNSEEFNNLDDKINKRAITEANDYVGIPEDNDYEE